MKRPSYLTEVGVGIFGGLEELVIKNPLRAANVDLPVSDSVQDFYYNNSGDFICGYAGAFFTNLALTFGSEKLYAWSQKKLSEKNIVRKAVEKVYGNHKLINLLSGLASTIVVVAEETQGVVSSPDIKDIPLGVAGALTHMGLRYLSIRNQEKIQEKNKEFVKRFYHNS